MAFASWEWSAAWCREPQAAHHEGLVSTIMDIFVELFMHSWVSLVTWLEKNPSTIQETWVQSLGWEDPLEKEMATPSSILDWEIPWTE